jgi:hypothetical protein
MNDDGKRKLIEQAIHDGTGILKLKPTWVAREIPAPGKRLGLPESAYHLGDRGAICERWLGSTTRVKNRVGPPDEGLSYVEVNNLDQVTLKDAVQLAGDLIMGTEYCRTHQGLGRLAKIFDYADRIPFHIHQMAKDAVKVDQNPKEESYYFPTGITMGLHPETYFGVHPWVAKGQNRSLILPYLRDWDSDQILRLSSAYLQLPEDGFHIPAGILHAPGTALTIELQEDSDVYSILQARVGGEIISKDFLYNSIALHDRDRFGEEIILEQINWELNADPDFYIHRHTPPVRIPESEQEGGYEEWIFYNTSKFSGKKLVVSPGSVYVNRERGVYNLLVWQGKGIFDKFPIEAGCFDQEELLVTHPKATIPHEIQNTGDENLVIFKFFGPDVNPDTPVIGQYS